MSKIIKKVTKAIKGVGKTITDATGITSPKVDMPDEKSQAQLDAEAAALKAEEMDAQLKKTRRGSSMFVSSLGAKGFEQTSKKSTLG